MAEREPVIGKRSGSFTVVGVVVSVIISLVVLLIYVASLFSGVD